MAERALATAFVNIVPGTADLESFLKTKLGDQMEDAGQENGRKLGGGILSAVKQFAGPIAAAFSFAAIQQFTQASLDAARAEVEQNARIGQIAESMGIFEGQAAAVTQRLIDMAQAQALNIGLDEDAIKNTQAKLLTFRNLAETADEAGGAFDRATMAAVDLAAAGFGSAETNAVALGKALNDPIAGITALSRMGVQFSEDQKAMIQSLVDTGDMAGAQEIILAELERQVGGTAAATATNADRMAQHWANLQETVGLLLLPVMENLAGFMSDTLLPGMTGFVEVLGEIPGWIQQNANWIVPLTTLLGGLVVGITAVGTAMKVQAAGGIVAYAAAMIPAIASTWAFTVALLANPITWIVIAVVALIAAIVALAMNWDAVTAWVSDVWAGFTGWLSDSFEELGRWWDDLWTGISDFVQDTWNGIVDWFRGALLWLVDLFLNWTLLGQIIKNWDAIVAVFTGAWNGIVAWFEGALDGFVGFWEDTWEGIGNFVGDVFRNIVNFVKAPINAIIDLINGIIGSINTLKIEIPDWVPGVGGGTLGFNLPKIPKLAKGGFIDSPTLAMVGEAGPEVVTPLRDFERMMRLDDRGGPTVNYYAAPGASLDSELELIGAMRRVKGLTGW